MSKSKKKYYDPDQDQDQDQKQDQRQAELQAQLQGQLQGQGQAQGQGQYQFALSENKNENENDNDNKNESENKNENANENKNENENSNENKVENKLDNKVDNEVDNKVDNAVDNKIENHVENKVETAVDVDVKVDLDLDGWEPTDDDVIDIDWIDDTSGSVIMPDVVDQKLDGNGNQFNIDQVNNLVDNDSLTATFNNTGSVTFDSKGEGGDAKIDDIKAEVSGRSSMGDVGTASADVVASAEAFHTSVVMGANIQFNNIEMSVAGNNLTSGDGDDAL
jgi:hypothetical protein